MPQDWPGSIWRWPLPCAELMKVFDLLSKYWLDILDIVLVTSLFYQIIQLLRSTRALAVLSGLGLLGLLYFFALNMGLNTTSWLLQHVFNSIFVLAVVIFQPDIRRALSEIGSAGILRRKYLETSLREEIVSACVEMARLRMGAIIVIQRNVPLNDLIQQNGTIIDAKISRRLLLNIFYRGAPLHDGAVVISNGRIAAAACILPLAVVPDQNFGTRHRAAIGLSEQSDAAVVVVSEERGEISFSMHGSIQRGLDRTSLRKVLDEIL